MTIRHDPPFAPSTRETLNRKNIPRSVFWTGFLLGVGIMAFLDETLLHQVLQWHTFYWNTDQHGRILSDGLFHAFSTLLLLWGAVRLWRGQGNWTQPLRSAIVAALLIGAGSFNLYDGLVQHVLLRFHIVNELVCSSPTSQQDALFGICRADVPYELFFDGIALLLLGIGMFWWRHVFRQASLMGNKTETTSTNDASQ
jgi:uncharacterized membrane protein